MINPTLDPHYMSTWWPPRSQYPSDAATLENLKDNDPSLKSLRFSNKKDYERLDEALELLRTTNHTVTALRTTLLSADQTDQQLDTLAGLFGENRNITEFSVSAEDGRNLAAFFRKLTEINRSGNVVLEMFDYRHYPYPSANLQEDFSEAREMGSFLRNNKSVRDLTLRGWYSPTCFEYILKGVSKSKIQRLSLDSELDTDHIQHLIQLFANEECSVQELSFVPRNDAALDSFNSGIALLNRLTYLSLDFVDENLTENDATWEGLQPFFEVSLPRLQSLESLSLVSLHGGILSSSGVLAFIGSSVQRLANLDTLFVSWKHISNNDLVMLAPAFERPEKITLKMEEDEDDDTFVDRSEALGSVFRNNRTVKELTLSCCNLQPEELLALAGIIPTMTSLEKLDLNYNEDLYLDEEGVGDALVTAVKKNKSITSFAPMYSDEHGRRQTEEEDEIHFHCQLNKMKAKALLKDEEVPLALWPLILAKLNKGLWCNVMHYVILEKPGELMSCLPPLSLKRKQPGSTS